MKERLTVTIDKKLLKWVDNMIEKKIFANRSHCLEFLVSNNISEEKNEQKKG